MPERIDTAGFGSMPAYQIDRMIHGTLRDVVNGAGMPKKDIDDNLTRIAESNPWHPAKDWIESKPWDGQDRLEFLLGSIRTPTPDLFRAYFRRWLLQCIEAACGWTDRREQEKALCLVLAGPQGIGKTRWLMSLAPDFTVRGKHLSLDGSASAARDSIHEALQGWIVELGELDTTFGKSANGSLKAFLSNTTDQYRLPYAEAWGRRPRCTSFCASVNDAKFLKDDTGSRRYMVIWTDHCDVDHATDMQQLWAQMHTYWKGGEQYWLTKAEERMQTEGNARHQAEDPVADAAATFAEKRAERSDRHPLECSVLAADVLQMLNLRMDLGGTSKRVAVGLRSVLGGPQQLDKRGGHKQGWRLWLDKDEVKVYGKMLRPSKA
jgi:predicted P-loop ATPase